MNYRFFLIVLWQTLKRLTFRLILFYNDFLVIICYNPAQKFRILNLQLSDYHLINLILRFYLFIKF